MQAKGISKQDPETNGHKRDVNREWRRLHNDELYSLYSSPNIIRVIKSRRLRWAGNVARMNIISNATFNGSVKICRLSADTWATAPTRLQGSYCKCRILYNKRFLNGKAIFIFNLKKWNLSQVKFWKNTKYTFFFQKMIFDIFQDIKYIELDSCNKYSV